MHMHSLTWKKPQLLQVPNGFLYSQSGYYQIEEVDKQKTAFGCPFGFREFNRMPQGITNVLALSRGFWRNAWAANLKEVLVFEDLIVF